MRSTNEKTKMHVSMCSVGRDIFRLGGLVLARSAAVRGFGCLMLFECY